MISITEHISKLTFYMYFNEIMLTYRHICMYIMVQDGIKYLFSNFLKYSRSKPFCAPNRSHIPYCIGLVYYWLRAPDLKSIFVLYKYHYFEIQLFIALLLVDQNFIF